MHKVVVKIKQDGFVRSIAQIRAVIMMTIKKPKRQAFFKIG